MEIIDHLILLERQLSQENPTVVALLKLRNPTFPGLIITEALGYIFKGVVKSEHKQWKFPEWWNLTGLQEFLMQSICGRVQPEFSRKLLLHHVPRHFFCSKLLQHNCSLPPPWFAFAYWFHQGGFLLFSGRKFYSSNKKWKKKFFPYLDSLKTITCHLQFMRYELLVGKHNGFIKAAVKIGSNYTC